MLIQPVQPVMITIKIADKRHNCQMISLSDHELELRSQEYMEKDSKVFFIGKYFRGKATIKEIQFAQYCFTYTMDIEDIQFQPGLLINTRL